MVKRRTIKTSLSLSAETSDHLNSACPPRVPPLTGSNIEKIFVPVWHRLQSTNMSVRNHNSSGLLSGVFGLLSRELESFVATATGANISQVCFLLI